MVMDMVTDYWRDERPASGATRRSVAPGHEVSRRVVLGDVRPGGVAVARPRRRRAVRSGRPGGPVVCADSHAPDVHRSRLTPRGRVVVAVVWLVMAAVAGLMLANAPVEGAQAGVTTKVMVEPGETLWQLAGHVDSGTDRQRTIATIMSLNDLDSASQIRPGDILIVPAQP